MTEMSKLAPVLRLNMSGRGRNGEEEAARYQAAIELSEYADRNGFAVVNVEEHHGAEIGWLPSPLILGAAIATRTSQVQIRGSAVLATLYDPIRFAEDVAMLDVLSKGRFYFVLGQGYREAEYHMMDRDFAGRGAATDHLIDTLLKAWTEQSFEYRGETVWVSPRPYSKPYPPFAYGGMSRAAAKRAARWGLPFLPGQPEPEIEAFYAEECRKHGHEPKVERFSDLSQLFIARDPDAAWQELGPYLIQEVQQYARWARSDVKRVYDAGSTSIHDLRAAGTYEILTPEQCVERGRQRLAEDRFHPIIHPLAGNIPIDRAWDCMRLFCEEVLPRL